MIVIVIMGVVYTLAVGNFKTLKDSVNTLSLGNLKEYLQSFKHTKSVELLCLDDCSSCKVLVDGTEDNETVSIDDFIDKSIKVYRYNFYLGVQDEEPKVYFNNKEVEERVCFSYKLNKKGIGDQVLVKYKNKIYDFSNYIGPTPEYNSMQELIDYKETLSQEVLDDF